MSKIAQIDCMVDSSGRAVFHSFVKICSTISVAEVLHLLDTLLTLVSELTMVKSRVTTFDH